MIRAIKQSIKNTLQTSITTQLFNIAGQADFKQESCREDLERIFQDLRIIDAASLDRLEQEDLQRIFNLVKETEEKIKEFKRFVVPTILSGVTKECKPPSREVIQVLHKELLRLIQEHHLDLNA